MIFERARSVGKFVTYPISSNSSHTEMHVRSHSEKDRSGRICNAVSLYLSRWHHSAECHYTSTILKTGEISNKHFHISSNKKKKSKNYASLILQLFLLIPLRQHSIAIPRFNSLPLVLLCHWFSFNHSVYHSNLAITGAYFRIILFLINTCTCASQSCSFSFVYLPLFR